ncbi:hypothetical protein Daus18300_008201 [Diaporthe australafricana]|uniref:2EXR domain-containing protein n=1 Tax=Diaporthe australafricana TaxID=127596 RepID=A0ABR3WJM9_9PEZI
MNNSSTVDNPSTVDDPSAMDITGVLDSNGALISGVSESRAPINYSGAINYGGAVNHGGAINYSGAMIFNGVPVLSAPIDNMPFNGVPIIGAPIRNMPFNSNSKYCIVCRRNPCPHARVTDTSVVGLPSQYNPVVGLPNQYNPAVGLPNQYTPAVGFPNQYTPAVRMPYQYTPAVGLPSQYNPVVGFPNQYTPAVRMPYEYTLRNDFTYNRAPAYPDHNDFDLGGSAISGNIFGDATVPRGNVALLPGPLENMTKSLGIQDNDALENVSPNQETPAEFRRFNQFPAEIRQMIWKMAMDDAKLPRRPIQRFRFNLIHDIIRKDSRYTTRWLACFTPLKTRVECNKPPRARKGARSHHVFLTACAETRWMMFKTGFTMLSLWSAPMDSNGNLMKPRQVFVPFNPNKGYFCVEGVLSAVWQAPVPTRDQADWPLLAKILREVDGLHGLSDVKHLAFVPHWLLDLSSSFSCYGPGPRTPFFMSTTGHWMAALAKEFPHLETVTSAFPQAYVPGVEAKAFLARGWLACTTSSFVGKRQGGWHRMSEEDREAVLAEAWFRIFDRQFPKYRTLLVADMFDDRVSLV